MTVPNRLWLLLFAALLVIESPGPLAASDRKLDELVDRISSEVRTDELMTVMRETWETDRWFTFPKFEETARNLSRTMEEAGLRQIEIVNPPADGKTQFGYWTMPLAWDAKQARLEIIDPKPDPKFRVLADFQETPTSLGMWSGPTPPGGLTTEVVDVADAGAEAIAKMDLQGKLVLTSKNPAGLKWALVKAGAAGAINAFTENKDLEDDRQWINAWGDAGWGFTKSSTALLGFSITPRQSAYLRSLLKDHEKVVVRAVVNSIYYAGNYPYVMGVVPGSDEDGEEVLTMGHMAEQGANDNATGVAAMVEALAAIHRLIEDGKLPRPKRTIRMIVLGELYGTMHYITQNPERMKRTVGAMCLDTPAGPYELAGTEYTFHMNPDVARSYTDSLIVRVAGSYFDRMKPERAWHWGPYMTGTDNFLGEPEIGVPTVWPYSGTGVESHHNSADTADTVDERSLKDLAVVTAAYLYTLASAGEDEALWLADVGLTRGYEGVLDSYESALKDLSKSATKDQLAEKLDRGLRLIEYQAGRERQAIESVERLVAANRKAAVREMAAPLVAHLMDFSDQQQKRFRAAAERIGLDLEISGVVEPARTADSRLAEAKNIVVRRKRPGTITFDDLPVADREGYPAAAWWGPPVSALFWCDGKRNLAEVIELTELELGPTDFDFAGYFRFLEKKGYVEFVK